MCEYGPAGMLVLLLVLSPFWMQAQNKPLTSGDINGDGKVDEEDLLLLKNCLAENLLPGQLASFPNADLDQDGRLSVLDGVALDEMMTGPQAGDLYETDPIVGDLMFVPAGTFTQGSPADEPCRSSDETQFTHTLTRDIAVMATEVTRRMWADLLAVQPSLPADPTDTTYGAGMSNPVQNNTWYEAVLFANLLSTKRGLTRCYYNDASFTQPVDATNYTSGDFYWKPDADGYRLLSEGEWEYACRAGTETPFWINESNYTSNNCGSYITTPGTWLQLERAAWFCANIYDPAGNNSSKPVGAKVSNSWGLYDTHGNVLEWCWDWYGDYPSGSATDHRGVLSGSFRVRRGGTWGSYALYCRSAIRRSRAPGDRDRYLGFRLVRTVP